LQKRTKQNKRKNETAFAEPDTITPESYSVLQIGNAEIHTFFRFPALHISFNTPFRPGSVDI
jgi:hypothetical protein